MCNCIKCSYLDTKMCEFVLHFIALLYLQIFVILIFVTFSLQ